MRHVWTCVRVVFIVLDLLLPSTDAGVAIQFLVVLTAGGIGTVATRSNRDLRLLIVGATVLAVGLMALRAVH